MFPLFVSTKMDIDLVLQMFRGFVTKGEYFEAFSVSSHGVCTFSYRESFEGNCSTQTNSKAETLWDYSTSSACWTRLETNQPAQIPGEE